MCTRYILVKNRKKYKEEFTSSARTYNIRTQDKIESQIEFEPYI
jgi:hypothetical protein